MRATGSLVALVLAVVLTACGSGDQPPTDPGAVVESYIAAYNAHDIDALMDVFSDESEIINHSIEGTVVGLDAIRAVHLEELSFAADTDAYTISNISTSDTTVSWDAEWVNAGGEHWCKTGHRATVQDGVILAWEWPDNSAQC